MFKKLEPDNTLTKDSKTNDSSITSPALDDQKHTISFEKAHNHTDSLSNPRNATMTRNSTNYQIQDSLLTDAEPTYRKANVKDMTIFQRLTHTFREGSSMGTVITLVMTAAVGPGVLSLPYAVAASGWALALIQLIFCAVMCNFTLQLMTKVGKVTQNYTYPSIAEALYKGKKLAFCVKIIFFLNNWGAAVADLILINDLITSCLRSLSLDNIPGFLSDPQSNFWPIFLGVFVGFPLCLKRNYSELRIVLFIGFTLTIYVVSVIFKDCVISDFVQNIKAASMFKPMGIFTTLPITFFSFACHPVVLDGYKELEIQSEVKYRRVLSKTMTVLLIFYSCIGIFGYFTFSQNQSALTIGNILLAYYPGNLAIELAILFFSVTMTFSLPLGIKPVKAVLSEIVSPGQKHESDKKHFFLTAFTVGTIIACSILVSNMTLVVGFIGASFNALIVFNLPCIYYIKAVTIKGKKKHFRYYLAHIVNISLFVFSIFSVSFLIYDTLTGQAVVGGG